MPYYSNAFYNGSNNDHHYHTPTLLFQLHDHCLIGFIEACFIVFFVCQVKYFSFCLINEHYKNLEGCIKRGVFYNQMISVFIEIKNKGNRQVLECV